MRVRRGRVAGLGVALVGIAVLVAWLVRGTDAPVGAAFIVAVTLGVTVLGLWPPLRVGERSVPSKHGFSTAEDRRRDRNELQAVYQRVTGDVTDVLRHLHHASELDPNLLVAAHAAELAWTMSLPDQPFHSARVLVRLIHADDGSREPQLMVTVSHATVDAAENVLQLIPALQQATQLPVRTTEKIAYIPPLESR